MKNTTPTPDARLAALVSIVQCEETLCGCPSDQLATANRFEKTTDATVFRIEETPCRVFFLRVMTLAEATAEAETFGDDVAEYGHPHVHAGLAWLVVDAENPLE